MITVVSNISDGTLAVYGLGVIGLVLGARLGWILLDLLVDAMRRDHKPQLLDEYAGFEDPWQQPVPPYDDRTALADDIDLPGDREHSWPGMAPLLVEGAPDTTTNPGAYPLALAPDLDEDRAPVDPTGHHCQAPGRVSVDEVTGYVRLSARIPDETTEMQVVAAVSSQDGPT